MKKIYKWILNYINSRRSKKLIQEAEHYLDTLEKPIKQFLDYVLDLQNQVGYLHWSYYKKAALPFEAYHDYFSPDHPFCINTKVEKRYVKLQTWLLPLPEYHALYNKYIGYKLALNESLNKVEALEKNMQQQIQTFHEKLEHFFKELTIIKQDYIAESLKTDFFGKYQSIFTFYKDAPINEIEDELYPLYLEHTQNADQYVIQWNKEYIQQSLVNYSAFFDDIDGKSLDLQQRIAVLTDEDNNLVLAGAGSGKTLTISGKVKFLTHYKNVSPEEILLISFTKKAAEEMFDRISKKLHVNVDVKTFHKLGNEIITKYEKQKKGIIKKMNPFVQKYFKSEIYSNPLMLEQILTFFGVYLKIPKDIEDYESLGDYFSKNQVGDYETLKGRIQRASKNLQTIKGETVKSVEETLIANFLFLNGIEYEYERAYEYLTATKIKRQYMPDFYLTDYGIYIEHFGVTEDMRAPWLSEVEEKKYLEDMIWKRNTHHENNTILIESFSYYNKNGVLFSKLTENLKLHGVAFKEVDTRAIYQAIADQDKNNYFEDFINLICSFLNLFKSNGYNDSHFDQLLLENEEKYQLNAFLKNRNELFFKLVRPILKYYQEILDKQNQIDFNDMINKATVIAKSRAANFPYKYIIIDEYQDISNSRFNLIKAIKDKTNAKIMCVGDDWQSIYRFTGSDIQLFTRFGEYFGKYELMHIERTYRNSQQLIDIAGKFVMENKKQLEKDLKSNKSNTNPIRIIGYNQNFEDTLRSVLQTIAIEYGTRSHIMLLGRNNFDINKIEEQSDFVLEEVDNIKVVTYAKYNSLKIEFMTAHKSKGLEADHVILINARNQTTGFPNRITDDPVLSWVLTSYDTFPFAEERRLFYVALTRTMNNLYILAPEKDKSVFISELEKNYNIPFESTMIHDPISNNPKCLKCQTGYLVERTGIDSKKFLGCSNYPSCDMKYNEIEILNNPIICDKCGGYMVTRNSNGKEFYGCTNYPDYCRHTLNKDARQVKQSV
ncbi:hypothetical protein Elgi_60280 [Paenibacillus elgii]|uniref:UvrD-helicase domain-containing protein n=1 Tax=Paenibacillus elgii TaxID=189691 RepID=UPI002D7CE569|nr:hypothetical protein Elgi_60280 [Paenibacillus elgii]